MASVGSDNLAAKCTVRPGRAGWVGHYFAVLKASRVSPVIPALQAGTVEQGLPARVIVEMDRVRFHVPRTWVSADQERTALHVNRHATASNAVARNLKGSVGIASARKKPGIRFVSTCKMPCEPICNVALP